ncbi:S9 family peptidase [Parapedobacter sp. 10938]|uniref:S9 family peptidase n=1 Tax=Parapedobacter flavus TaxID=3110225 RepID=UPI002DBBDCB4|nr:prolyl oligopeptidase family serine peptidase [Parapedobacter sp. 10938]MEC3880046.1 prolyl oligopeptidase family serine peptidase [Parapedobacter sp. 10938]
MKKLTYWLLSLAWVLVGHSISAQQLTMETVTSYPFPSELATSAQGNRMAVAINEQGRRNLYVAEGPDFTLRKLTHYDHDLGDEITSVQLSADGQWVVYVKGGDHGGSNASTPRNPASLPVATKVQVWSVPFAGGDPVLLTDGDSPVVSPAGDRVAFIRQGQVWVSAIDGSAKAEQLFYARGSNGSLQWSPDGTALAFVSSRGSHSLIGIFRDAQTPIQWIAPAFARDGSPRWSPDGKRIAFVRRDAWGGAPDSLLNPVINPWAIWTANVEDGTAAPLWHAPRTPQGAVPTTNGGTNLHWVGNDRIAFVSYHDSWPHLYSISDTGGEALLLTPGDFMVEHVKPSPDRKWLLASANTGPDSDDIDRRHLIAVPVDKTDMRIISPGEGIETFPHITGDGSHLVFLSATATRPNVPAVLSWPGAKGDIRPLGDHLIPAALKNAPLVTPSRVEFKAADGVTVYGQLFEPEGSAAKKPAIVFIHGGPQRQMLLGWHYGDYYSNTYALNQYLVSRGFVVLSVNYRLGIGYGFDFHKPLFAGRYGAAEYQDIKAAGEWLAAQPQVDASRIGVYGGSYGGYLTALALGKDSDLFAAGVDIHGVHNYIGRIPPVSAEPAPDADKAIELAKTSSPVSYVDTWRSPVLLIHGDDDANVDFEQTIDLLNRLKRKGVPHETLMIPDDTHHWMLYKHQVQVDRAVAEFLERHLLDNRH